MKTFIVVFICLWSMVSLTHQKEPEHGVVFNKDGDVRYALPKYQGPGLKQNLTLLNSLTFVDGQYAIGRRHEPRPQMVCRNCQEDEELAELRPRVAMCTNKGVDERGGVVWECVASDEHARSPDNVAIGWRNIQILCERYEDDDSVDDVLVGSCVIEYDLTVFRPPSPPPPPSPECRVDSGVCDPVEYCDGTSPTCPADTPKRKSVICRPGNEHCDVVEYPKGCTTRQCQHFWNDVLHYADRCGNGCSLHLTSALERWEGVFLKFRKLAPERFSVEKFMRSYHLLNKYEDVVTRHFEVHVRDAAKLCDGEFTIGEFKVLLKSFYARAFRHEDIKQEMDERRKHREKSFLETSQFSKDLIFPHSVVVIVIMVALCAICYTHVSEWRGQGNQMGEEENDDEDKDKEEEDDEEEEVVCKPEFEKADHTLPLPLRMDTKDDMVSDDDQTDIDTDSEWTTDEEKEE